MSLPSGSVSAERNTLKGSIIRVLKAARHFHISDWPKPFVLHRRWPSSSTAGLVVAPRCSAKSDSLVGSFSFVE